MVFVNSQYYLKSTTESPLKSRFSCHPEELATKDLVVFMKILQFPQNDIITNSGLFGGNSPLYSLLV